MEAAVGVAHDEHGTNLHRVVGPMEGPYGLPPPRARPRYRDGHRFQQLPGGSWHPVRARRGTAQWIRVENLIAIPKVAYVLYRGRRASERSACAAA